MTSRRFASTAIRKIKFPRRPTQHPQPQRQHGLLSPATPRQPLRQLHPSAQTARFLSTPKPQPSSSVDPNEVRHFNALASSWWDSHGPSRLLHLMNPLRHTFINRCLSTASPPTTTTTTQQQQQQQQPDTPTKLTYLDIGCGGGIFAESAARLPTTHSVTAIDPSPEVLSVALAHRRKDPLLLAEGKLTYLQTSIENLPNHTQNKDQQQQQQQQQYDIVTVFEVLEHVANPSTFLEQVSAHVKPGGWLILSTIARTWTSWAVTKVMAEDVLGIVPRGTHEWEKYVNEEELRHWFGQRGDWDPDRVLAMGVLYVPGLGWREVSGGERFGNYFFGVRKML